METFYRLFNSVNQFSYILIGIAAIVFVAFILYRRGTRRPAIIGTSAVIAALLIVGLFALRIGDGDAREIREADAILNNGKPTFLEFFSNYCAGCMSLRPVVDQIVNRLDDGYNVLRVDIPSEAGRELRERLGFTFTPEFVLYSAQGREVWRSHLPPSPMELDIASAALGES